MIVYIDLYFLMNVQMNLVLLWMEGILLKRKFRFGRFVLAAVVSALLAVLYLVSGIGARWFLTIPFTLSTWFLTIRLAFGKITKISFARNYVVHDCLDFSCLVFCIMRPEQYRWGKDIFFLRHAVVCVCLQCGKKERPPGNFQNSGIFLFPLF